MTRLAVGRPTLAVSSQNSTKSDFRRSEIKNVPGGHISHVPHSPSARASRALCHESRAHWNPPFQNPRSATGYYIYIYIYIYIDRNPRLHETTLAPYTTVTLYVPHANAIGSLELYATLVNVHSAIKTCNGHVSEYRTDGNN